MCTAICYRKNASYFGKRRENGRGTCTGAGRGDLRFADDPEELYAENHGSRPCHRGTHECQYAGTVVYGAPEYDPLAVHKEAATGKRGTLARRKQLRDGGRHKERLYRRVRDDSTVQGALRGDTASV